MDRKVTTLPRTLLVNMVMIVTVAVGLFVLLSLYFEGSRFEQERHELDRNMLEPRKQELKRQVDSAIEYLEYRRSRLEEQAQDDIRQRVEEAHAVATHIVARYRGEKSPEELQDLVREALRPIRYAGGKGYYFATGLDGTEQLFADRPSLEGKNLLRMQDTEGRYVIRDMIRLARTKGAGFYRYTWTKPDQPGKHFRKISYLKKFAPFNWFIGTGLYLDDVEQQVKTDVAGYLENIRFGKDGYIFAGQWDGYTIAGPAKGKNMLSTTDAEGNPVVERLIQLAKSGGGYVTYRMPDLSGVRQGAKMSYVRGVKDWQWYVGAGIYVEDVESSVRQAHHEMVTRMVKTVLLLVLILALFVAFAFRVAQRAAARTQVALDHFHRFFEQAATGSAYLAPESLPFEELQSIACSANQMVEERRRIEEELHQQAVLLEQEVAERQEAQESLAGSKRELEAINATLNERIAAEVAENIEKNRIMIHQGRLAAMGEMISSIAHQWRQPLNNLGIMLQSIRFDHDLQELDQETLDQHVATGMEMIMYMSKTIDDFRNFFMPEREPQSFDLMGAVRSAVSLLKASFDSCGVQIIIRDEAAGSVDGFPREFAQAVLNILNNAKDACVQRQVAHPCVEIHARRRDGHALITISDNAGGIPAEIIDRIFDPYFTTKPKTQGTGLGLYMAKMIIEKNMGGQLTVSNTATGAEFRIQL